MPNVFEFLGLPANHRPKNKVVQLVKNFNEVPASKIKYPLMGQVKKDGVFALVVVNSLRHVLIFGRTGELYTSTQQLTRAIFANNLDPGIYIGELLSEAPCSLEELSGVVNPNRVNALDDTQADIAVGLYISWYDYITLSEFIRGVSSAGYLSRYRELVYQLEDTDMFGSILPLVTIHDSEAKDTFTKACLSAGEEGAVYKQLLEGWVAGHKGYKQMKEVGEVSYDLICTRVEEGEGKYTGLVANMYFRWKDGTEIKAMPGKGHTHESCRKMWLDKSLAVGRVWRVKGLMNSSKGKIRLPKVEEERYDKITADY